MVRYIVRICLTVLTTVEQSKVSHWVKWGLECIVKVRIYGTAISVGGVKEVGEPVVVVIPIDVVFKSITINIRVYSIRTIIAIQCTVDCVKIAIVVQITIPIDIDNVDDAIVVGENIYRYQEKGLKPLQAAIEGTAEVFPAVSASVSSRCAGVKSAVYRMDEEMRTVFTRASA